MKYQDLFDSQQYEGHYCGPITSEDRWAAKWKATRDKRKQRHALPAQTD